MSNQKKSKKSILGCAVLLLAIMSVSLLEINIAKSSIDIISGGGSRVD